jgi:hypothetical protein
MQKAAFIAHSPYELGDTIEVVVFEGIAVTGYPRATGTKAVKITDIMTLHSLKNNTVTFLYDLEEISSKASYRKIQIVHWAELVRR